jgi:hypothetical protein
LSPDVTNNHSRRAWAEVSDPELIVTNLHRNYTGVSTTIGALLPLQAGLHRLWLVGGRCRTVRRPIPSRRPWPPHAARRPGGLSVSGM